AVSESAHARVSYACQRSVKVMPLPMIAASAVFATASVLHLPAVHCLSVLATLAGLVVGAVALCSIPVVLLYEDKHLSSTPFWMDLAQAAAEECSARLRLDGRSAQQQVSNESTGQRAATANVGAKGDDLCLEPEEKSWVEEEEEAEEASELRWVEELFNQHFAPMVLRNRAAIVLAQAAALVGLTLMAARLEVALDEGQIFRRSSNFREFESTQ
ncbi:hypothetical protein CYMTET_29914, partial [Cymbomonas tetramitiformis]